LAASKEMKTIHIVLLVVSIVIVGYITFVTYALGDLGGSGKCYGKTLYVDLDSIKVEEQLIVSNGKILFSNLTDTLSPIMIKVDKNDNVEYAIKLEFDSDCISLNYLTGFSFDEKDKKIRFFNGGYGEPGYIKLTKDYHFDYAYTSPF
jgi:hypothetical protein